MLPLAPSLPSSAAPPRARVLVVDDEPAVCRGLRLRLRACDLSIAGSVDQAVTLLRADAGFDLVLCDVMMPGKLGTELVRWIEQARPDLLPRLVMMTGGIRDPHARLSLEFGDVPLLYKPLDVGIVRRMAEALVRRRVV